MLCWFSTIPRSLPSAWLVLLLLCENSLSSEPLLASGAASCVPWMQMEGGWSSECGAGWCRTSVFPKLIVGPNCWDVSENLSAMTW